MRRNTILFAIIKVLLLCFGVMGVVGLVLLFWIIPQQVHTPEVAVPNLVGQSYEQAVLLITSSGLAVESCARKKAKRRLSNRTSYRARTSGEFQD